MKLIQISSLCGELFKTSCRTVPHELWNHRKVISWPEIRIETLKIFAASFRSR